MPPDFPAEVLRDVDVGPLEQAGLSQDLLLIPVVKQTLILRLIPVRLLPHNLKSWKQTRIGLNPLKEGPFQTLSTLVRGISLVSLMWVFMSDLTLASQSSGSDSPPLTP